MLVIYFVLLVAIVFGYFYFDQILLTWIIAHKFAMSFIWLKFVTVFGESAVYLLLIPIIWIFTRNRWQLLSEKLIYVWSVLLSCNILALTIKILLGRARPNIYILTQQYGFFGPSLDVNFWSMPSGHVITLFALLLLCGVVCATYRPYLWCLTVFVMLSRLFLLKHYISDMLLAIVLDLVVFYCFNSFIYRKQYLLNLLKYIESDPKLLARFLFYAW